MLLAGFGAFGPRAVLLENLSGTAPEQGTGVCCAWDASALCVRFECVDREPWATITQRDGPLWEEEVVEVFLDPVGDGACYFEIEVNPLGTVLDLVLRRNRSGYRKDFAWDCEDLRVEVGHTPGGWNAELVIPFASVVAEPPRVGSEWRVNFTRIDRPRDRERELSAWTPTRLATFHAPERFGVLRFG
ncbi:MAG: carbohydrate-binding family 9-like protein [Chthoniobacteraceae bacterium]